MTDRGIRSLPGVQPGGGVMPGMSGAWVMSSCWNCAGVIGVGGRQRRPAPAVRGALTALPGISGANGLLGVAAGDLDVAGLGALADRNDQGEHAGRVIGGDLVGVEGLAEE